MTTPTNAADRTGADHPRLGPHPGRCGDRHPCWRSTCRAMFDPVRTVEILPDRSVLAHCHGRAYPAGDLVARLVAP